MNSNSKLTRFGKGPKAAPRGSRPESGPRKPAPRNRSRQISPSTVDIKSILVPLDFSPASEKALVYALPLARLCDAKLTLVHVIEPIATPDFVGAFPLAMENGQVKRECKQHLQRVVEALELEPSVIERLLVRNGRAFDEIASAARSLKADLIVISTHGRTGLKHALLGSTAERVVQHAPCPVLVVRPNEREFLRSVTRSNKEVL